jgi:hypothetical protein
MNIEDKTTLHSIIGGMTTDYFDFFCKECGANIPYVDFYGLDSVGVRLLTKCVGCGAVSIFKIKKTIKLGPIETTCERGRYSFKAYDKRKLKRYKREIEDKKGEQKGS